jgi:translation elongation factor EF-1alpha
VVSLRHACHRRHPTTNTDLPAMGRFTLRDEGRTIAIGKVTKLPKNH